MSRVEKIRRRRRNERGHRGTPSGASLTHGRLYALPDGTEFAAAVAPGGRHVLYHPLVWAGQAWIVGMPVSFVITEEGHVLTPTGRPTGWRVEDLVDGKRVVGR